MLGPSAALIGANLGKSVALVTDGRFSGATHGRDVIILSQFYLHVVLYITRFIMLPSSSITLSSLSRC